MLWPLLKRAPANQADIPLPSAPQQQCPQQDDDNDRDDEEGECSSQEGNDSSSDSENSEASSGGSSGDSSNDNTSSKSGTTRVSSATTTTLAAAAAAVASAVPTAVGDEEVGAISALGEAAVVGDSAGAASTASTTSSSSSPPTTLLVAEEAARVKTAATTGSTSDVHASPGQSLQQQKRNDNEAAAATATGLEAATTTAVTSLDDVDMGSAGSGDGSDDEEEDDDDDSASRPSSKSSSASLCVDVAGADADADANAGTATATPATQEGTIVANMTTSIAALAAEPPPPVAQERGHSHFGFREQTQTPAEADSDSEVELFPFPVVEALRWLVWRISWREVAKRFGLKAESSKCELSFDARASAAAQRWNETLKAHLPSISKIGAWVVDAAEAVSSHCACFRAPGRDLAAAAKAWKGFAAKMEELEENGGLSDSLCESLKWLMWNGSWYAANKALQDSGAEVDEDDVLDEEGETAWFGEDYPGSQDDASTDLVRFLRHTTECHWKGCTSTETGSTWRGLRLDVSASSRMVAAAAKAGFNAIRIAVSNTCESAGVSQHRPELERVVDILRACDYYSLDVVLDVSGWGEVLSSGGSSGPKKKGNRGKAETEKLALLIQSVAKVTPHLRGVVLPYADSTAKLEEAVNTVRSNGLPPGRCTIFVTLEEDGADHLDEEGNFGGQLLTCIEQGEQSLLMCDGNITLEVVRRLRGDTFQEVLDGASSGGDNLDGELPPCCVLFGLTNEGTLSLSESAGGLGHDVGQPQTAASSSSSSSSSGSNREQCKTLAGTSDEKAASSKTNVDSDAAADADAMTNHETKAATSASGIPQPVSQHVFAETHGNLNNSNSSSSSSSSSKSRSLEPTRIAFFQELLARQEASCENSTLGWFACLNSQPGVLESCLQLPPNHEQDRKNRVQDQDAGPDREHHRGRNEQQKNQELREEQRRAASSNSPTRTGSDRSCDHSAVQSHNNSISNNNRSRSGSGDQESRGGCKAGQSENPKLFGELQLSEEVWSWPDTEGDRFMLSYGTEHAYSLIYLHGFTCDGGSYLSYPNYFYREVKQEDQKDNEEKALGEDEEEEGKLGAPTSASRSKSSTLEECASSRKKGNSKEEDGDDDDDDNEETEDEEDGDEGDDNNEDDDDDDEDDEGEGEGDDDEGDDGDDDEEDEDEGDDEEKEEVGSEKGGDNDGDGEEGNDDEEEEEEEATYLPFPGLKVILPTAPKLPISAFDGEPTRAWYDYLTDHEGRKEDDLDLQSLEASTARIHDLLRREIARVGAKNVFLGGASQGCCTALHAAATWSGPPLGGFVGTQGHLLSCTTWPKNFGNGETPVRIYNGLDDTTMPWHSWVASTFDPLKKGSSNLRIQLDEGVDHGDDVAEGKWLRDFLEEMLPAGGKVVK